MSRGTTLILILVAIVAVVFLAMTFDSRVEDGSVPPATTGLERTEEGTDGMDSTSAPYGNAPAGESRMPGYGNDGMGAGMGTDMDTGASTEPMGTTPDTEGMPGADRDAGMSSPDMAMEPDTPMTEQPTESSPTEERNY